MDEAVQPPATPQAPPAPQEQQSSYGKKNWKKWILILAGVLVIAVILGGVYYLGTQKTATPQTTSTSPTSQPTTIPDETANWKTYTSKEFGYLFKFPRKGDVIQVGYAGARYCPAGIDFCGMGASVITISVHNSQNLPFDTWLQSTEKGSPKPLSCILKDPRTKETRQNFLGYKAIVYEYFLDEMTMKEFCKDLKGGIIYGEDKSIVIERGTQIVVFEFQLYYSGDYPQTRKTEDIKSRNEYETIFSTFKFTDQTACQQDKSDITALIDKFETLQTKKDPLGVLALFTPPTTSHDIAIHNFFLGKGVGGTGTIRLYNTAGLLGWGDETSYTIGKPTNNPTGCTIQATETWQNHHVGGLETINSSFDVVKQGSIWTIDKWYQTGQTPTKYRGGY